MEFKAIACITKSHNDSITYRGRNNGKIDEAERDEKTLQVQRHFRCFHDTPSIVLY